MSKQNNNASLDATATIGTLIDEVGCRDAIHVAVVSVIASCPLTPGSHVGFVGEGTVGIVPEPIGIIDPFLGGPVFTGQRCWMLIYPRTITGLRHVWTHPAVTDEGGDVGASQGGGRRNENKAKVDPEVSAPTVEVELSRCWLTAYAEGLGWTYERLIGFAGEFLDCMSSMSWWDGSDEFASRDVPEEFWDHFQKATGREVAREDLGNFFRCSC